MKYQVAEHDDPDPYVYVYDSYTDDMIMSFHYNRRYQASRSKASLAAEALAAMLNGDVRPATAVELVMERRN